MLTAKTASKKLKSQANGLVSRALAKYKLKHEDCEICGCRGLAHHEDYERPLEIKWLCGAHHAKLHKNNLEEYDWDTKLQILKGLDKHPYYPGRTWFLASQEMVNQIIKLTQKLHINKEQVIIKLIKVALEKEII